MTLASELSGISVSMVGASIDTLIPTALLDYFQLYPRWVSRPELAMNPSKLCANIATNGYKLCPFGAMLALNDTSEASWIPLTKYHTIPVIEKAYRCFTSKKETIVKVAGAALEEQHDV